MTDLFQNHAARSGPVECLGQTFPSDEARREHYLKLLAEKIKDPAFRKIEGFPLGSDEDILAMSDPPYYTACPNPFLEDFVRHYGKPYDPNVKYSREPQTIDVSVGKTDPLYKAHSYHTKVPHLAIVPSILHYTEPGDIVLDGFGGSGKRKGEIIPELDDLLEDNFLRYDGDGDVPNQISNYLSKNFHDCRGLEKSDSVMRSKAKDRWYVPDPNKAQDLEKKREKALLKEFATYRAFTGRKINESRLEVLRAGFRAAWANKDYATIISIAAKLPDETLQEDEKLLTLYDLALTRTEDAS